MLTLWCHRNVNEQTQQLPPIVKFWEKGRYDSENAGNGPEVVKRRNYKRVWKGKDFYWSIYICFSIIQATVQSY